MEFVTQITTTVPPGPEEQLKRGVRAEAIRAQQLAPPAISSGCGARRAIRGASASGELSTGRSSRRRCWAGCRSTSR